jgi:hypothetical protein
MRTSSCSSVRVALFVLCGVGLLPTVVNAQTLQEFNSVVERLSANSPALGPRSNPMAAVFVSFRASKKLCWSLMASSCRSISFCRGRPTTGSRVVPPRWASI